MQRRTERDQAGRAGGWHQPVLRDEAIEALAVQPGGVYVDGTYGRGGHSAEILRRLGEGGRLIAIDRDPEAVTVGRRWTEEEPRGRFEIEHAWFSELDEVLSRHGVDRVEGVLLDLGVSSPQLDDPSRGFSFRESGPLDMRMDPTRGMSARQWLEQASEASIAEALRDYGEERFAVQIAAAIAARRGDAGGAALQTTGDLASLVAGVVRRRRKRPEVGKDPATRTFQALRILVNQELEELARVLDRAVARLKPGGRLVVISFHSIEDRIVKRFIARECGRDAPRDPVRGTPMHARAPRLRAIARVLPSRAETDANPRARSAVMRVAERLADPGAAMAVTR